MTMPRQSQGAINWDPDGRLEALSFDLHGETFALEAMMVQEILDLTDETLVPGAPSLVGGVINYRGKVIPLADLGLAFGMAPAEATSDSRIVVIQMDIEGEMTLIGLRTDKVHEVTSLAQSAAEPPPSIGMRWRADYVHSLVKRDGDFIVLPDLTAIFASLRDHAPLGAAPAHPRS